MLARKYRPSTFADLIGQDAMVRTISNAFETGRIPQAWVLTGVRGVGKTTTARILARALNYELPDGSVTGPTIDMPVLGVHCQAIMESRHLDVIEMDAASHNGVEDVRAINEAIRYAPVSARYKVYILDEVHMLSAPPSMRCSRRWKSRRRTPSSCSRRPKSARCRSPCCRAASASICAGSMRRFWSSICKASPARKRSPPSREALALIARAAEGSVRDALSLFDQAIAHSGGAGNSPMSPDRFAPKTCGRCSALPTAPRSSICSRR